MIYEQKWKSVRSIYMIEHLKINKGTRFDQCKWVIKTHTEIIWSRDFHRTFFWHIAIRSKTDYYNRVIKEGIFIVNFIKQSRTSNFYFLSRVFSTYLWHIGSYKSFHLINTCWYIYQIAICVDRHPESHTRAI